MTYGLVAMQSTMSANHSEVALIVRRVGGCTLCASSLSRLVNDDSLVIAFCNKFTARSLHEDTELEYECLSNEMKLENGFWQRTKGRGLPEK